MKPWTSLAYFAVVAASVACAALQPSHASATEENAVLLGDALWPTDEVGTEPPLPTARTTRHP